MKLIDTHAHLYLDDFDLDREVVIRRAIDEGVVKFYIPAIDSNYHEAMEHLYQSNPDRIRLMMGLHPCYVKNDYQRELRIVEKELASKSYSAIGEIGLDYYWSTIFVSQQKEAFQTQLGWAKEKEIPVAIHSRDSIGDVLKILEKQKSERLTGVFHCFTGTLEQAMRTIDLGFLLGIGGLVTFKNGGIDKIIDQIPLDHIVLETDTPYLSPSPHRGKRNEPAYLKYIVSKIADCYGICSDEVAKITTENAIRLFGSN